MSEDFSVNEKDTEILFGFISLLRSNAMIAMGKTANPMTGKIERDFAQVDFIVDLVEMFKRKMAENLTIREKSFIEGTLGELRMNYVDELNKSNADEKSASEESENAETESSD